MGWWTAARDCHLPTPMGRPAAPALPHPHGRPGGSQACTRPRSRPPPETRPRPWHACAPWPSRSWGRPSPTPTPRPRHRHRAPTWVWEAPAHPLCRATPTPTRITAAPRQERRPPTRPCHPVAPPGPPPGCRGVPWATRPVAGGSCRGPGGCALLGWMARRHHLVLGAPLPLQGRGRTGPPPAAGTAGTAAGATARVVVAVSEAAARVVVARAGVEVRVVVARAGVEVRVGRAGARVRVGRAVAACPPRGQPALVTPLQRVPWRRVVVLVLVVVVVMTAMMVRGVAALRAPSGQVAAPPPTPAPLVEAGVPRTWGPLWSGPPPCAPQANPAPPLSALCLMGSSRVAGDLWTPAGVDPVPRDHPHVAPGRTQVRTGVGMPRVPRRRRPPGSGAQSQCPPLRSGTWVPGWRWGWARHPRGRAPWWAAPTLPQAPCGAVGRPPPHSAPPARHATPGQTSAACWARCRALCGTPFGVHGGWWRRRRRPVEVEVELQEVQEVEVQEVEVPGWTFPPLLPQGLASTTRTAGDTGTGTGTAIWTGSGPLGRYPPCTRA